MRKVPTITGFWKLGVLILLLTACRTTAEPDAFEPPPPEAVAFMATSTNYVCTPHGGKTKCWCEKAAPADSVRSCNGLDKMCRKFGKKKKCDSVDMFCSCSFKL